ncbi:MAG: PDZ domain-containing protein [Kofleriaceae bacterium]|nr:PDZ domain-containing protein [Kofleriaceae bacterium]
MPPARDAAAAAVQLQARLIAVADAAPDVDADAVIAAAADALAAAADDPRVLVMTAETLAAATHLAAGEPAVEPGFRVHRAPDGAFVVAEVLAGGGAAAAGLKPGDVVLEVAGAPMRRGNRDLLPWFGRAAGTAMPLRIQRGGAERALTVALAEVGTPPVALTIKGKVGILRIHQLTRADDASRDGVAALRAALATCDRKKVTGLVLDLRGDLGGTVPMGVASLFTNAAQLVAFVDAAGNAATLDRDGEIWPTERPIEIIVDDQTRDMSELLALALQDLDVAYVVGEPSAGTLALPGTIDLPGERVLVYPYADTAGPVSRTPPADHRVTPTLVVANRTAAQLAQGKDPQLDAAIADVKRRARQPRPKRPPARPAPAAAGTP